MINFERENVGLFYQNLEKKETKHRVLSQSQTKIKQKERILTKLLLITIRQFTSFNPHHNPVR